MGASGSKSGGGSKPKRKSRPKPKRCTPYPYGTIRNLKKSRDNALNDRNKWKNIANDKNRQLGKIKGRIKYFPKNMDPSNIGQFAEDIAIKAGLENIKLKNSQDGHLYTQKIVKKERSNKLEKLSDKENKLRSQLLLNDRLLMYRSTNINILKYIYRIICVFIILVICLFGYKYVVNNLL